MLTTIISTIQEVYQFDYSGRNKVIKAYKRVKDFYSQASKEEGEQVYSNIGQIETESAIIQPMVYELQTPKGNRKEILQL